MFNRRRAIGLDIGPAAVRALVLEGRPGKVSIAATAAKPVVEGRLRLLERAAVKLRTLDVEALAVLNATLHLARLDPRELLVTLDLREERAILCLLSERGPVVVRYLEVGGHADVAAPAARAPLTEP